MFDGISTHRTVDHTSCAERSYNSARLFTSVTRGIVADVEIPLRVQALYIFAVEAPATDPFRLRPDRLLVVLARAEGASIRLEIVAVLLRDPILHCLRVVHHCPESQVLSDRRGARRRVLRVAIRVRLPLAPGGSVIITICTRRAGKLYRARSRVYRSQY